MKKSFEYRLGLDLGTNSIGWAVMPLSKEGNPKAIAKAGVRIFSDGRHPKDKTSLAVQRRQARQIRRRRDRLLKRTARLVNKLEQYGFLPPTQSEKRALAQLDPYKLRAYGLDNPLEPYQFGRLMLHLSKRRGFKSNRKTDGKENDLGALKQAIRDLENTLDSENCRTLGEWLAKRHLQGESVRARLSGTKKADKAYDFYATREMIANEFDELWRKQSELNPVIYTAVAQHDLRDTLLFQRDLVPVKPGRCTLLPEFARAPLALPSTQRFRILQELNNLRLINRQQESRWLTLNERNLILEQLEQRKDLTFARMKTLLKLRAITFNLEGRKRDRLKGNATSCILGRKDLLNECWSSMEIEQKDRLVSLLLEESSTADLVTRLTGEWDIDVEMAEKLSEASLPKGYGQLSYEALSRIIPCLNADVITYDMAVKQAGFQSHSQLTNVEQTGEILDRLPYYGKALQRHVAFAAESPRNDEERYGKIANPTVHICLNQLRVVVNDLIKKYGLPDQINVEVTRDLKFSRQRKVEIDKAQTVRQKQNAQDVDEVCQLLGWSTETLSKSQRREITQKMQLWRELDPKNAAGRSCPYSGEQISMQRLFSDSVEIEHILPFSRTLDDSMANKTIATTRSNRAKGNRTPWEAFGEQDDAAFDYESILLRVESMPLNKRRRFGKNAMSMYENDGDFLARALTDTAYISRLARDYLALVCLPSRVQAIPGRLTALIRGKLGLNNLIMDNQGNKNREDHRHHAIDAIVIGITERNFLAAIARANSKSKEAGLQKLIEEMPIPWPTFRNHAKRAIDNITASHRPDHGYQGRIMEDTAWGLSGDGAVHRRILDEQSGLRVKNSQKKKVLPISDPDQAHRHGSDEGGEPIPYKGYVGGSNYCIEITVNQKGKWEGNVVSTFDAYQIIKQYGEADGFSVLRHPLYNINGKALVLRLMQDDYVYMNDNGIHALYRVVKITSNQQVFFAPPNEANVDARDKNKQDKFKYISKKPSTLQKAGAMRATISPTGKVTVHKPRAVLCQEES